MIFFSVMLNLKTPKVEDKRSKLEYNSDHKLSERKHQSSKILNFNTSKTENVKRTGKSQL